MKKKTLILIGGLIIIVGLGGFLYYRYISSPEYSLKQIKRSYEEHDVTLFEKHMDIKTMTSGILDKTLTEMGEDLVNLMRPQVEEVCRQQILKLIETGEIGEQEGKKGFDELWKKNDAASFKQIKEIKRDGKVATIGLEFNQPRFDTTLVLNIKMRDKGSYWQLFDISNIFELSKTIETLEERRVNRLNEEVKKRFFENIKISEITLKTETKEYSSKFYALTYNVDFENIGDKNIDMLTCLFDIIDYNGSKVESVYIRNRVSLDPGEKYKHQEVEDIYFGKVNPQNLTMKIELVELEFKDGSKIEWNNKWQDLNKKSSSQRQL